MLPPGSPLYTVEIPRPVVPITYGLDRYKVTMGEQAHQVEPDVEVEFTLHNRGEQRLLDYIDPTALQARFDAIIVHNWSADELEYLGGLRNSAGEPVHSQEFLDYLASNELPPVTIYHDKETDDIAVHTRGPWALVTFWETIVMSEVNESYFEAYLVAHNLNPMDVYDEGDRRLTEKVKILQAHPEIKFADFGTRRRFSLRWQEHVLRRLLTECPDNFVGTSNVGLAQKYGIKPIGTFAHEMFMVYAALADARGESIRGSHNHMLVDWFNRFGVDQSIALTDTFGSKFFFSDFTPEQAAQWRGMRHDSGDPFEFGERLLKFYEDCGVDPITKTVVFSDGLDIDQIVKLQERFGGRINVLFGWGTTLTNDLGIKPLNIVMKATHVYTPEGTDAPTIKFSDNRGKRMGPLVTQLVYDHAFATAA